MAGTLQMNRQEWIRQRSDGRIVDIGGEDGYIFRDYKDVVIVDIDEYDVENFVRADAHDLPFKDNVFDTAVLAEILEHVEDPVQVLKEADRVADKLVITVPNEYEWPEHLGPFKTGKDKAKEKGVSLKELAKEKADKAIDIHDDYTHLWHRRFYTEQSLKAHLEQADIENYEIGRLQDNQFSFFTVLT